MACAAPTKTQTAAKSDFEENMMGQILRVMVMMVTLLGGLSTATRAHEVRPSVADITVNEAEVTVRLTIMLEPAIAGIDLGAVANTDESALSAQNDTLRALPPDQLRAAFEAAWGQISQGVILRAGETRLTPEVVAVEIPAVGDVELPRDSILTLTAALPPDGTPVTFGLVAELGGVAVRQQAEGASYSAFLAGGEVSDPLPRGEIAAQSTGEVFVHYLIAGFEHIIPLGIDHILFVLGLFFFALAWRPLLWQVSAFTLAHTITLALATLGLVTVSPAIVEPLIAASIAYVAIENIFHKGDRTIGWTRIGVVFGFGLLHGLGFASVLGDFGLDQGQFLLSLVAFNVGVEMGQLAVIAVAFFAVSIWAGRKPWYRSLVVVPASAAIAVVGLWWAFERTFLG
jgi:hypothetical protein